jgi:transcriptional regulator with XRE-family HTH domain
MAHIGNTLRYYRRLAKLTQKELASLAGVAPNTIIAAEQSADRRMHKETFDAVVRVLAEGLGRSPEVLEHALSAAPPQPNKEIVDRAFGSGLTGVSNKEAFQELANAMKAGTMSLAAVNDRLWDYARLADLSLETLAAFSGVDKNLLSSFEQGLAVPTYEQLDAMFIGFGKAAGEMYDHHSRQVMDQIDFSRQVEREMNAVERDGGGTPDPKGTFDPRDPERKRFWSQLPQTEAHLVLTDVQIHVLNAMIALLGPSPCEVKVREALTCLRSADVLLKNSVEQLRPYAKRLRDLVEPFRPPKTEP